MPEVHCFKEDGTTYKCSEEEYCDQEMDMEIKFHGMKNLVHELELVCD